jgi:hypothetical protein
MIELADTCPDVDVQRAEYQRLLGYPRGMVLEGRARELAAAARAWYAQYGRPWVYARQAALDITNGSISIDGAPFSCQRLRAMLEEAGADSVILVAASAGGQLEHEAQQLWREEKPDEYFFLEVYGSAVVEHLVTMKGAELCGWAESRGMAVLPHYSPGYTEWDVAEQPQLLELIRQHGKRRLPGGLETLDSGMLRPKKSLLAVFGLTRHTERVGRLTELNPCENCSFQPCQYRRAPYRGEPRRFTGDEITQTRQLLSQLLPEASSLDHDAQYSASAKALARWAANRLKFTRHENGMTDALFRYEGTTCTNLGRPLFFDYHVTLGPRADGYRIHALSCQPALGDEGHRAMCRYTEDAPQLMSAIEREKPLLGNPLNSVLTWNGGTSAAGCYCELSDRMHKWRLVLETIHFALVQRELGHEQPTNGQTEST